MKMKKTSVDSVQDNGCNLLPSSTSTEKKLPYNIFLMIQFYYNCSLIYPHTTWASPLFLYNIFWVWCWEEMFFQREVSYEANNIRLSHRYMATSLVVHNRQSPMAAK